jgi:hypothetical protein
MFITTRRDEKHDGPGASSCYRESDIPERHRQIEWVARPFVDAVDQQSVVADRSSVGTGNMQTLHVGDAEYESDDEQNRAYYSIRPPSAESGG